MHPTFHMEAGVGPIDSSRNISGALVHRQTRVMRERLPVTVQTQGKKKYKKQALLPIK